MKRLILTVLVVGVAVASFTAISAIRSYADEDHQSGLAAVESLVRDVGEWSVTSASATGQNQSEFSENEAVSLAKNAALAHLSRGSGDRVGPGVTLTESDLHVLDAKYFDGALEIRSEAYEYVSGYGAATDIWAIVFSVAGTGGTSFVEIEDGTGAIKGVGFTSQKQ